MCIFSRVKYQKIVFSSFWRKFSFDKFDLLEQFRTNLEQSGTTFKILKFEKWGANLTQVYEYLDEERVNGNVHERVECMYREKTTETEVQIDRDTIDVVEGGNVCVCVGKGK